MVNLSNSWPRGFYGEISIDIKDEVEDGWEVTLVFTKPVRRLQVWNAKVDSVSDDRKTFVLTNKFWNAKLAAGTVFKFKFLGKKMRFGERTPKMSATFDRLGEGSGF